MAGAPPSSPLSEACARLRCGSRVPACCPGPRGTSGWRCDTRSHRRPALRADRPREFGAGRPSGAAWRAGALSSALGWTARPGRAYLITLHTARCDGTAAARGGRDEQGHRALDRRQGVAGHQRPPWRHLQSGGRREVRPGRLRQRWRGRRRGAGGAGGAAGLGRDHAAAPRPHHVPPQGPARAAHRRAGARWSAPSTARRSPTPRARSPAASRSSSSPAASRACSRASSAATSAPASTSCRSASRSGCAPGSRRSTSRP